MSPEYKTMLGLLDDVFTKELRPSKLESNIRRIKRLYKLVSKNSGYVDLYFADLYMFLLKQRDLSV